MEFNLKTYASTAEIIIESGSTKITEELSEYSSKTRLWQIPESTIKQLITLAFEMSRFNGTEDVNMVEEIFKSFLNNSEQSQFLENQINE